MLALRRELGLGSGSLSWLEDWCTDSSLAYLNGDTLVVMNVGHEPLELPAGDRPAAQLRRAAGTQPTGLALGRGDRLARGLIGRRLGDIVG